MLKLWRNKVACKRCGAPLNECDCMGDKPDENPVKPKVAITMSPKNRTVALNCECGWHKTIGSMVYLTIPTLGAETKAALREHAKHCTLKGHGLGPHEVN